ncbi:hypothetical protein QFC19_005163 [Naganishia cerealis]|uniref:Uncharacterized protein n=1 Tax=Naganishia cerealis TaxID=610337 RepID=A0ACC2VQZ7_9TREE|nr:hypothetical protein QFC19_005163 [Naganishia cerealis]
MASVIPNDDADPETDTPRTHTSPAEDRARTDLTPIAAPQTHAVETDPTHDQPHTAQSLYSNRLRSHHRYQQPNPAPLPSTSTLHSFPSSTASSYTRLPPPIGIAESPLTQYRVLNRLAARPPSGARGSVGSVSRAGSGLGAEGEGSGLTPSHSHRPSATGIPLRSSIDDRGFRLPSSSSAHHTSDNLHQHLFHLPVPNSAAVSSTSFQALPPNNFGPSTLQDRRPSTATGAAPGIAQRNSPAQSPSIDERIPDSSTFRERTAGSPPSVLRLFYNIDDVGRISPESKSTASAELAEYELPPPLHSASISSYDYEVDYPHYHNQQLRSAGVPPTVSYPGLYTERSSVGSAYTSRPIPAARPDEGAESHSQLGGYNAPRERYPTPELVYFTEGNGNGANPESQVALDVITNKRRRLSAATLATGASTPYHTTNHKEGFVADWSYPTLAPVNPPTHHLSQPTSPRGTVQPFSYAYSEPEALLYPSYPLEEPSLLLPPPPSSDDPRVQRFNRLCDEEKRELEVRRTRQLAGPDSEATFRQSLKRLANEITGVPYTEDNGELCVMERSYHVDRIQYNDNIGNGDPHIDTMPTRHASPGQTTTSSQASGVSSNPARLTRAAAAAAQASSQPGSVAPSMQSSRPSMSSYRYSNGGLAGNSAGLPPAGGYMMNAPAIPAGRSTRARVYREIIGGKEQSIYGVEDETPAPLPGTTGGQQKRKASSNAAASLRSTATYNGAMGGGNGLLPNGYHQPPPSQAQGKRRKPDDGYGYYRTWDDRASAVGSVRLMNGKAGTAGSTATQSTANTGMNINPPDRHLIPPSTGHYGSHYIPDARDNYYPSSAKSYNSSKAQQALPPSRPAYHAPQYAVPAEHPAPKLAQAQPQQIAHAQAPSQSSQVRIIRLLGQGTFGKVVEATEKNESVHKVAVKIIRAVPKYREAAGIEIRVLRTLRDNDPENKHKCIHLLDTFDWRNHICLVTPLYGQSVFDFLKENKFQPFPEKHIQSFAASLLDSLKCTFFESDRANSKSKHILRDTEIRLIDFGSATFDNEFHSSVVSTRHYRAPEIILGERRNERIAEPKTDWVWCLQDLGEFYTGDALFQTHDNLEHLAMMEVVMGKMPLTIANRACKTKGEYFKGNKLDYPNTQTTKHSKKFVKAMKPLNVSRSRSLPIELWLTAAQFATQEIIKVDHRMTDVTNNFRMQFLDLVIRLLHFDPQRRMTVSSALNHNFFKTPAPAPPIPPKNAITNASSVTGSR